MSRPRFRHQHNMGGPGGPRPRFRNPNTYQVNARYPSPLTTHSALKSHDEESGENNKPLFYRPPSNQQTSSYASHQKNFRPTREDDKTSSPHFMQYSNSNGHTYSPSSKNNHPGSGSRAFNQSNNGLSSPSTEKGSSLNMVLSKMQESAQSAPRILPATKDVLTFLREFKPLECSCCEQIIGFQHRNTGVIMCGSECAGPQNSTSVLADRNVRHDAVTNDINHSSNGPTYVENIESGGGSHISSGQVTPKAVTRVPIRGPSNAPGDDEYRHVSSLHKYEAPVTRPSPIKPSHDTVDNKVFARVGSEAAVTNQKQRDVKDDIRPNLASGTNPFFKSLPSAKEMIPPQVSTKAEITLDANSNDSQTKAPPRIVKEDVAEHEPTRPKPPVQEPTRPKPPTQEPTRPKPPTQETRPKPPTQEPTRPVIQQPTSESTRPVIQKPKFSWFDCKFSSNLTNGVETKVAFVWSINKYQLQAAIDEEPLTAFQERVQNYVAANQPMTRKPVKNEIVLGLYCDEHYRARVTKVKEDGCELMFVDFGDASFNKMADIYEPNEDLMQYPISSVSVILAGVPNDCPNVKAPKTLNDHVFSVLTLDLIDPDLRPIEDLEYEAKLWVNDTVTLNKLVLSLLKEELQTPSSPPLNRGSDFSSETSAPVQKNSLAELDSKVDSEIRNRIRTLKEMQEKRKADEATELGISNDYVFSLDDPDYTDYFFMDLPVVAIPNGSKITIEVSADCQGSYFVEGLPKGSDWELRRRSLSKEIKEFVIGKRPYEELTPRTNQLFLVKWPTWKEIDDAMIYLRGKERWKQTLRTGEYKRREEDERRYEGQWFRALYLKPTSSGSKLESGQAFLFYLFDLGKELIVPKQFIHKPVARLMIAPQLSISLGLLLEHETQYTEEVHKKWAHILKPGLELYVETVCDIKDITYARLLTPSEETCNAQYSEYLIRKEKQDLETMKNEIETNFLKLVNDNAWENLGQDFYQKQLDKLKADYIEKERTEKSIQKYSNSKVIEMFPYNQIRPIGDLEKFILTV